MQIHGPIDLRRDVARVCVHVMHRKKGKKGEEVMRQLRLFREKFGVEVVWMDTWEEIE